MSDISIIEKELQNGTLLPQGSIHGNVWSVRDGLKIEFTSDDENAEESVTLDSDVILFFGDYEGTRPVWMHKTHINGNVLLWKYDASIWRVMNLLKVESVRLGVAYYNGFESCCMYIRNSVLAEDTLPENKYAVGMLDEKDNTVLTAVWTGNGFLSVKVRASNSFTKQFYQTEVSGYRYENGHFIIFAEIPLIDGAISLTFGKDTDKRIEEFGDIIYTIEEKECSSVSRILKIDMDMEAFDHLCVDGEDLRLMPVIIICDQLFPLIASEAVLDDKIFDLSTKHKVSLRRNSDGRMKVICAEEVYDVLLSVVTAVYNTAPFLAEMIESVLSQKLDKLNEYIKDKFKNVFEFILVDDGSTDGSGEILDNYARMFDCIKVIHKENGGVSSARNTGLEIARGKYVNFADSDDKLNPDFMEKCILYFEKNISEILAVTTPMNFFDAKKGGHWTNKKFSKSEEIVDLLTRSDAIFYGVSASVFRRAIIEKNALKFDIDVKNGEDWLFIENYLMEGDNTAIGLVGNTCYWYRKRSSGAESAVTYLENDEFNYRTHIEKVFYKSFETAKEKYGFVPYYIQEFVAGQLQWKFLTNDKGEKAIRIIGKGEFECYKELVYNLLSDIDDSVILKQPSIYNEHKYFMLKKKYGSVARRVAIDNDIVFSFGDSTCSSFGKLPLNLEFIYSDRDKIILEGNLKCYEDDLYIEAFAGSTQLDIEFLNTNRNDYSFDEVLYYTKDFRVIIPISDEMEQYRIRFVVTDGSLFSDSKNVRVRRFFPISGRYKNSYYMFGNWVLFKEDNEIVLKNLLLAENMKDYEYFLLDEVRNKDKGKNIDNIILLRKTALHYLAKQIKKRQLWLISDQPHRAGDNGEALFKYLSNNKEPDVDAFFVIDSQSPDYDRLKTYGNVVKRNSRQHYILHLMADCIISSAADDSVCNPWINMPIETEVVKDLLNRPKYVFLQHGITKDDISGWINKYKKNLAGIVCASNREAKSFLDYDYYYDEDVIWCTGFPRHDYLYNDEKKYITILPTWRKKLTSGLYNSVKDGFENSDYFKFYNSLINNRKLLDEAEKMGYTIAFMPHPTIRRDVFDKFDKDERVSFFGDDVSYTRMYAESNMVVTDYSSAVIDFALLRKPIVYCQFDKEEFFSSHSYKPGYFDYEEDGFGEVTYDMENLINLIISYMKNGCKIHEPYEKRMVEFFNYSDKKCCNRVVDRIKSL